MTNAQFKDLDGFVSCSEKHSDLPLLAGCFADGRADPDVPSRAAGLSLLLGEVAQIPGLLQLEEETKSDPLRVVRVRERWTERKRQGKEWKTVEKEQTWIWVVAGGLDAYDGAAIRDFGHLRWKIENNALGELTQHWHLTHVAHHKPVAVLALRAMLCL